MVVTGAAGRGVTGRGASGHRRLFLLHGLFKNAARIAAMSVLLNKTENQGHGEKMPVAPFGDFRQHVARTRAEQRVRRAAAKGRPAPASFSGS